MTIRGARGPGNYGRRGGVAWWPRGAMAAFDFKRGLSYGTALTPSRASSGYAQDSTGLWLPFAANALRRTDLGALIEPAGTNSIRNPRMVGAVAGTPGTLPTNLAQDPAPSGVTQTLTNATSVQGVDGFYLTLSGTPTASGTMRLFFDGSVTQTPAATGQSWVDSAILALTAGSAANSSLALYVQELTSAGGNVLGNMGANILSGLSAALSRPSYAPVLSGGATTASVRGGMVFGFTAGQAVNLTLFIGWTQLEQSTAGAPSSPILPPAGTIAASTRAADVVTVQGTGMARFVYTFDDGSTQTVAQNPATQHVIPTNLNRRYITRLTGYVT